MGEDKRRAGPQTTAEAWSGWESDAHVSSRIARVDKASAQQSTLVARQSYDTTTTKSGHGASEREVVDAATILEFLAWGRCKQVDYLSALPTCSEDVAATNIRSSGTSEAMSAWPSPDSYATSSSPLLHLQILLPDREKTFDLVKYHVDCLLWCHCSFHGSTFLHQLERFYSDHDGQVEEAEIQWVALLFAVLAASISCGNRSVVAAWGFRSAEQSTLSQKWFEAARTCLNAGHYMTNLSMVSCQTIATLTMSAHLLGHSDEQAILLACATRIAQSLGLHRLDSTRERSIEVETGRRLWCQLCTQDWFAIAFTECYLISPLHTKSAAPSHCDDDTMQPVEPHEPTISSYCRFLNSIAELMPPLQDDIEASNTLFTKYEKVLAVDKSMRQLAMQTRPSYFGNIRPDNDWPRYITWARRAAAISSSHKIIMIHRKFLSMSYTSLAFAFTRRTCIAASKTILKEFRQALLEDGPVLWIYHAFAVAAAITLSLDILHSDSRDASSAEHEELIIEAITNLRNVTNSKIANRGAVLLESLVKTVQATKAARKPASNEKRPYLHTEYDSPVSKRHKTGDIGKVLQDLQDSSRTTWTGSRWPDPPNNTSMPPLDEVSSSSTIATFTTASQTCPQSVVNPNRSYDAGTFAEVEGIFASLNASFAGTKGDAFGTLLNMSHNYSYA
ncbi:hypothetical protein LTR78_003086 [Recurvomyces mirabilis]|uniref:Transcription factor domain-containing protein n=1 Tax=Recurvomyces mirabilis TaxID=574656 RepID=A0AAE0WS30_9PEZI|nr:hypothetical protein LTR78_003086 [Recurvomyces mirabilis]KAK5157092.1 hypothetical protein LTS14_004610 [Recurvomyces mirabilis]